MTERKTYSTFYILSQSGRPIRYLCRKIKNYADRTSKEKMPVLWAYFHSLSWWGRADSFPKMSRLRLVFYKKNSENNLILREIY